MSSSEPKVVLALPAYNEEEAVEPQLRALDRAMSIERMPYRVILVNDGSSDNTRSIAESLTDELPLEVVNHEVNMGLSGAMRTGLTRAVETTSEHDIIASLDTDNTQPVDLIPRMVRLVREGNDVVVASRYRYGSCIRGVSFRRRVMSRGAGILFQTVHPIRGVRDFTCGFRAYRRDILAQAIELYGDDFIAEPGFSCQIEILVKLAALGAIITEVPMVLRYDLKAGASKMNVKRTVVDTLWLLLRARFGVGVRRARDDESVAANGGHVG